jgi:ubiquinone/menaquinone biosynthesis C-methylase UbiE
MRVGRAAGRQRDVIRRSFWREPAAPEPDPPRTPESQWFWDHYEVAVAEIVEFCEAGGVRLDGLEIADIGCGDGMMALGLCHRVSPRKLVGFDVAPTQTESLLARAHAEGAASSLPDELEFRQSTATSTPAPDDAFDFVYSWSAFEHIGAPYAVLTEVRRILRPGGCFFLQLWPFYRSAKGSHLWHWFDDDFHHLLEGDRETVAKVRSSDRQSKAWTEYMIGEFETLNRISVDQLQRAVIAAGFRVDRLELMTAPVQLTPGLEHYSWSDLAISGIKLLARPGP